MRVLTGRVTAVFVAALAAALALPAAGSAQSTDEDVIVVLRESAAEPGAVAAEHARAYGARARMLYGSALNGYAASIPANRLDEIRRDPRVAYVAPDRPVTAAAQGLAGGVKRGGCVSSSACS